MRLLPAIALAALACTTPACGSSPAPVQTAPGAVSASSWQIQGLDADAGVVGIPVALTATTVLPDGTEKRAGIGAAWSSSNAGVASVDASGIVTPLTPGFTVIRITLGGATADRSFTVVPNVAGAWTGTFVSLTCPGIGVCDRSGVAFPRRGDVTLTQSGTRISGKWGTVHYLNGRPPFSGRIDTSGRLTLDASYCWLDDVDRGTRFVISQWVMTLAADGTYEGDLHWEQWGYQTSNDCSTGKRVDVTDDVRVTVFRRMN